NWLVRQDPPQPLPSLGLEPWRPSFPAVLGQVLDDEAAGRAGLQPGDRIVTVDGEPVEDWLHFVDLVRGNPETTLLLEVARGGETLALALTPGRNEIESGVVI